MSDSIFESTTPDEVNPAPAFTLPTEVVEFVGEGKKYHSVEDALKSVPHAQSHIQKLEEEMAKMREELARRKTAEELLEEMKGSVAKESTPPVASFDPSAMSSVVEQVLTRKEQERMAKENVSKVIQSFSEKFGDKAEEEYIKVAQQSGIDIQNLNKLAASSPTAVLRLAGIDFPQKREVVGKPSSSINTEALASTGGQQQPSARVQGTSTKDLVAAWRAAGELIKA